MFDNSLLLLYFLLIGLFLTVSIFILGIKSYKYALILIFTLSFSQGVLQLMGVPTIVPRIILESSILLLFFKTIYLCQKRKVNMHFKWGSWMLSIFSITIFSAIINKQDILSLLLFCRHTFIFYLFFVTIYNISISFSDIQKVNQWIIILLLIQIPAAIIKLISYGKIVEGGGIGTISVQDGSAALLISLIPISFLFSKYIYKRKVIYLILCFLFLIVSIASGKRATAFVLPAMLLFVISNYLLLENKARFIQLIKMVFGILIISFSMLYVTSQTSSFLNPEGRQFSGAFDLDFMIERIKLYVMISESEAIAGAGRGNAMAETYSYVSDNGIGKLLMGFGPGSIIGSSLVKEKRDIATIHNLSYGSRSGFIWIFLQIGLVASILFLLFIINWFFTILAKYRLKRYDLNNAPILLGLIGCLFIMLFDVVFYSASFIINGVTMPLLYYISGIYLSPHNQ